MNWNQTSSEVFLVFMEGGGEIFGLSRLGQVGIGWMRSDGGEVKEWK